MVELGIFPRGRLRTPRIVAVPKSVRVDGPSHFIAKLPLLAR